jgi:hypothetical protein
MALALRSCSSLPLHLILRHASSHLGALNHRRPPSARLQSSAAAASSYKEAAAGNNDGIIAAAATCAPVEVDAAAAEQLAEKAARRGALPGYPHEDEGRPSHPKEGNNRDMLSSNPSPPGPPVQGSGGNGGAHN